LRWRQGITASTVKEYALLALWKDEPAEQSFLELVVLLNEGQSPKTGRRMAAKKMPFPWR
jgi:hypothetical protein